jgi:hypothetical protein
LYDGGAATTTDTFTTLYIYIFSVALQVKSIKQHPDYRFPFIAHDLAILTLDASVNWTSLVSPVCLPSSTHDDFSARMAELAGWG